MGLQACLSLVGQARRDSKKKKGERESKDLCAAGHNVGMSSPV
jgi:hypothetical protein